MVKNLKWKLAAAVLVVLALFSALALYVLIPRMYNLSVSIDFSADKEAGREKRLSRRPDFTAGILINLNEI